MSAHSLVTQQKLAPALRHRMLPPSESRSGREGAEMGLDERGGGSSRHTLGSGATRADLSKRWSLRGTALRSSRPSGGSRSKRRATLFERDGRGSPAANGCACHDKHSLGDERENLVVDTIHVDDFREHRCDERMARHALAA